MTRETDEKALLHSHNRARPKPASMTSVMWAKLDVAHALLAVVRDAGGTDDPDYPLQPSLKLATRAGDLHVYVSLNSAHDGASAYCRFNDVDAACELLGRNSVHSNLNPHSGKWNHNYWTNDAEAAVADLRAKLARVALTVPAWLRRFKVIDTRTGEVSMGLDNLTREHAVFTQGAPTKDTSTLDVGDGCDLSGERTWRLVRTA